MIRPIAAILLAAAALLAGCGSGNGTGGGRNSAGSDPFKPAAVKINPTTPAPSGTIDSVVWNIPFGEPASLDPLRAFAPGEQTVLPNVCDALLRTGPELKTMPGLAESWKRVSPEKVRFRIRDGVRFWDGSRMTVDDVLYSLRRHLDPAAGSFYSYWAAEIRGYEQTGPNEITMETKVPDAYVFRMLATGLGTIVKREFAEERGDAFGTPRGGVMCTGPFELDEWRSGQQMVLAANDDYWDSEKKPRARRFEFRFVTDPSTLVGGLAAGEIDGSFEVPIQGLGQLESAGSIAYGPNLNMGILQPMQRTGPSSDPAIRRALSMAIDREGIARAVFSGYAVPQRAAVPTDAFGDAEDTYRDWYLGLPTSSKPDIARAKQLVAEAGAPDKAMTIGVQTGDSQSAAVATAIQSAAKEIGLRMEVRTLPAARYQSLVFSKDARKGIDWSTGTTNYINVADPIEVLFVWAISDSPFNLSGFSSAELDSLFERARAEEDPKSRAKLVVRALDTWVDPPNNIPLYLYPSRLFMSKRISGSPTGFPTFNDYPWAADIGAR